MFRIGSITKSFIALVLLNLGNRGDIDLKARVADLAPELQIENRWQREAPITVASLKLSLRMSFYDARHSQRDAVSVWFLEEDIHDEYCA